MRIEKKLGKLVRLDFEFDSKITSMKITGDFFIHPESAITQVEQLFVGRKLPLQADEITGKIDAEIIGFTIEQLEGLINDATN